MRDNFFIGFLLGWISIGLDLLLLKGTDYLINAVTSYGHILNDQRTALVTLAFNVILFRFLIVKWNRIQTGKGLLLTIIIATLIYGFRSKIFQQ